MFRSPYPSDETLVRNIIGGRTEDYAVLMRRYFNAAHAVAYACLANATEADDATQELDITGNRMSSDELFPEQTLDEGD